MCEAISKPQRYWDMLLSLGFIPEDGRGPIRVSFSFISLKFFPEDTFIPHVGTTLEWYPWDPNLILFLSYIFPRRIFLDLNILAAFDKFETKIFLFDGWCRCCWRMGDGSVSWRWKKNILFDNISKTILNISSSFPFLPLEEYLRHNLW